MGSDIGVVERSFDDSPFFTIKDSNALFRLPVWSVGRRGFFGDGPSGVPDLSLPASTAESETAWTAGDSDLGRFTGASIAAAAFDPKKLSIPF
jgi:hypothetical protein